MSETSIQQTVSGDRNIFAGSGDINIVYNLPPVEADTRRNLLILLDKVKHDWIEGVLEPSVHHEALLPLGKESRPEMVEHPWARVLELPEQGSMVITAEQQLGEIFEKMGRTILILGEPGSGKTITLLELAKELLVRAQDDPIQPIPVVFNLSTWTENRPFKDWLMDELTAKYQIPRRFSGPWLENQRLLLLLDGLDEVAPQQRAACVQAINAFVDDLGVPGLAVCSRLQEYSALPVFLKLRGAICLQPLSLDQINNYLAGAGSSLAALQAVVQTDPVLQELAQTPLMLSVMSLAYHDLPVAALTQGEFDSPEKRRHHLFDTYIDRMLKRQAKVAQPYESNQVIAWLSWLANKMTGHSRTIFLIEELQPSWLSTRKQLWACMFSYFLTVGLFLGLLVGVKQGVAEGVLSGFIAGLTLALSFCLVFGLFFLIASKKGNITGKVQTIGDSSSRWTEAFKSGLYWSLFGLVYGVIAWEIRGLRGLERNLSDIVVKVFMYLIIGLSLVFFGRRNLVREDIQTVEALSWSWAGAWRGSAAGIIFGLFLGTIFILYYYGELVRTELMFGVEIFLTFGLALAVIFGVAGAFYGGLKTKIIEKKTLPNQGVILTIKNAVLGGLGIWLIMFLVSGLFAGAPKMLAEGLTPGLRHGFREELSFVLSFSLLLGLLPGLSFYGGLEVVRHYVLRLILFLKGHIPLNYARFLDYAAKLIFLRQVGGGYIFTYRQLQDHFAALGAFGRTERSPEMPLPEPQPLLTARGPSRESPLAWLLPLVGCLVVLGVAGGIWWHWSHSVVSLPPAYVERGLFYARKGQRDLAIADYSKAIELNPKDQKAYFRRGLSYGRKGQRDLAIADYSKAIELNPKDQKAYLMRGLSYGIKGQRDLAIADFSKAIELNPKEEQAYFNRGLLYDQKGQRDLAIADYSKAIELNPKEEQAYLERGLSYGRKGQYDLTMADFSKAIELNPRDALAYRNRGVSYGRKGQHDLAIADFGKAIELNPKDELAYLIRGLSYAEKGRHDLAIADYSKAIELNPKSAAAYNQRGFIFLLMGKFDAAEKDIKKSLELNPDQIEAIMSMAELYSVTGKTEDACHWLEKAIKKGYKDWHYIKTFKTFDNIRNSPCYQEIMKER